MTNTPDDYVRLVLQAASEDAPRQQIQSVINDALAGLRGLQADVDRGLRLVNTLAGYYGTSDQKFMAALSDTAPIAVTEEQPAHELPIGYDRRERTMQIATEAVQRGERRVSTERMAAILRNEGDPAGKLTTAIGNILSHAGWTRVKSGLYEAAPEQDEDVDSPMDP